jgi:RimJ/RimL family protein N-acetyltransferase
MRSTLAADPREACARLLVPLTGTLVRLEPLREEHADELWQAAVTSDWTLMPLDAGASRREFDRWLASELERAEAGTTAPFVTAWRKDGRPIGATHCHEVRPEHRRLEIGGTWLARSFWRTGANVETKLLLLEHIFGLGFQRVEFKTDPDNLHSRRALEALPATFEGVLRKHLIIRGDQPRDSAYYSIVDSEWPTVKANLQRRLQAKTA